MIFGDGNGNYDNFAWGLFTQTGLIGYYLLSKELSGKDGSDNTADGVNPRSHRGPFD